MKEGAAFSRAGTTHMSTTNGTTTTRMRKLLLFDIDGTLILTGGAGGRAMTRAFEATYGLVDALRRVDLAGRTDRIIISDALSDAGLSFEEHRLDEFRRVYCEFLREELPRDLAPQANGVPQATGSGHVTGAPAAKGALPGVRALLDALVARDDVHLALLTGNFSQSAEIKLAYFDLWRYFAWGAYGEDAFERHKLLPIALDRHRAREAPIEAADVIIIGDTPHDIHCARSGGARVVAVATGNYSAAALRDHEPDVLLDDLADTPAFLHALGLS
jgi:phosphoglycolate phosphatase